MLIIHSQHHGHVKIITAENISVTALKRTLKNWNNESFSDFLHQKCKETFGIIFVKFYEKKRNTIRH